MISSNEFILFYNELFKFLDSNFGKKDVEKLWGDISKGKYCSKLDNMVKKDGLKGMYNYWDEICGEEGDKYSLTLKDNEFILDVHRCSSVCKLTNTHVKPYKDYCGHCPALYIPIYKKYGFKAKHYLIDKASGQCRDYIYK
jgi:hypothetical protein